MNNTTYNESKPSEMFLAMAHGAGYIVKEHTVHPDGTGCVRIAMPNETAVEAGCSTDGSVEVSIYHSVTAKIPHTTFNVETRVDAIRAIAALRWAATSRPKI